MVRQWEHMVKYGENMGNMMIKPWGFWGSLFSDKARNRHETANWHCLEPKGRWTCVYCHIWREYEWVVDVVNQELNHVESLRKAPTTPATPHPKALRCSSSTLSPEGIRISWQRWGVLHKKTQLYITIHHTTTILVTSSCYTLLIIVTIHHITSRFKMLNSCTARSALWVLAQNLQNCHDNLRSAWLCTYRQKSGKLRSKWCCTTFERKVHNLQRLQQTNLKSSYPGEPLSAKGLRSCSKPEAPPIMPQGKSGPFFAFGPYDLWCFSWHWDALRNVLGSVAQTWNQQSRVAQWHIENWLKLTGWEVDWWTMLLVLRSKLYTCQTCRRSDPQGQISTCKCTMYSQELLAPNTNRSEEATLWYTAQGA